MVERDDVADPTPGDAPHWPSPGVTTTLSVRVVPSASRSEIVGASEGSLRVRLAAPASKGKANKELVKVLARALGVRSREVEIVAGHKARLKKVQVHGVDPKAISELMGEGGQQTDPTSKMV